MFRQVIRFLLTLSLLTVWLAACSGQASPAPTVDGNAVSTQAFATIYAAQTGTAVASIPTETPVPSATATYSGPPPALPPAFTTTALDRYSIPHTYISDTCQYLKAKWDPNNAAPGTIVMAIMFHGVEKGVQTASDPLYIGGGDFKKLMNSLHDMGFQAVNTQQVADFLYNNAKIPPRSVMLIKDDRHHASDFNDWFRPYWQKWGWPVVDGWISGQGGNDPYLAENVDLGKEGWVDYQAHGFIHNINMYDNPSPEFARSELQGSIDVLQKYFGKTPLAIIWPGGGFRTTSVEIARQLGYKLGFTINPRGPMMFNWIPLGDVEAPADHPGWLAEGPINDPLMTLPRFWDTDAINKLDTIRAIGEAAAAYAQQNKSTELLYYDVVCAPALGPLPTAAP